MSRLNDQIQINSIPFSVVCFDNQGRITGCNLQTELFTGYRCAELIDKDFGFLIGVNKQQHVASNLLEQNYFYQLSEVEVIELVLKSGEKQSCTIKVSAEKNGFFAYIDKQKKHFSPSLNVDSSIIDQAENHGVHWSLILNKVCFNSRLKQ